MSERSREDLIERLESHMGKAEVPDLLRDCRLAAKAMRSDRYAIDTLTAVLASYEKLEADIILNGDWADATVRLAQRHHDSLIEIQGQRNAALALVRGEPNWPTTLRTDCALKRPIATETNVNEQRTYGDSETNKTG